MDENGQQVDRRHGIGGGGRGGRSQAGEERKGSDGQWAHRHEYE